MTRKASAIGLLAAAMALIASNGASTPAPDTGEAVYYHGAGGLACSGCHGIAGQGGGEGGTAIPGLKDLAGPDKAYDSDAALCRALRSGVAPDGRTLSGYMPRTDMSKSDCMALFGFLASLEATALPGLSAREVTLTIAADPRNAAQVAWREHLLARFRKLNEDGGLHGRTIRVLEPGEPGDVFLAIGLDGSASPSRPALFELSMRGDARVPFRRVIETARSDEVDILLGLFPKSSIALFVDEADPAVHEAYADRAADTGATIVATNDCGSPPAEVVIVIDQPVSGLPRCAQAGSYLVSLRNISLARSEDFASLSSYREAWLAVPLPMGAGFSTTSDSIAQVVLNTLRQIGRHPDKAEAILAFESAWRAKAARQGNMFAGMTVGSTDPDDMGRWIPVP